MPVPQKCGGGALSRPTAPPIKTRVGAPGGEDGQGAHLCALLIGAPLLSGPRRAGRDRGTKGRRDRVWRRRGAYMEDGRRRVFGFQLSVLRWWGLAWNGGIQGSGFKVQGPGWSVAPLLSGGRMPCTKRLLDKTRRATWCSARMIRCDERRLCSRAVAHAQSYAVRTVGRARGRKRRNAKSSP